MLLTGVKHASLRVADTVLNVAGVAIALVGLYLAAMSPPAQYVFEITIDVNVPEYLEDLLKEGLKAVRKYNAGPS